MNNNPFDDIPDAQGQQQGVPQQPSVQNTQQISANPFDAIQPEQQSQGWFMDGVDAFNRQFEKMAIGTLQLANYANQSPAGKEFGQALSQVNKQGAGGFIVGSEQADKAYNDNPLAYAAGGLLGTVGSAVGFGGVGSGLVKNVAGDSLLTKGVELIAANPILGRTALGAAGGAAFGLTSPADSLGERATNTAVGGLVGGVASNIMPALKAGKDALLPPSNTASSYMSKVFTPQKAAIQDVASKAKTQLDLNGSTVDDSLKPFNDIGVDPKPSQAFGSPALTGLENNAVKGDAATHQMAMYDKSVLDSSNKALGNTIDNISTPENKAIADTFYPQLKGKNISNENLTPLLENKDIKSYLGALNKTDLPIAKLPDSDLSKLNYIKKAIDKDIKFGNEGKTINQTKNDSLIQAKNMILEAGDKEYGDIYVPARKAAQKSEIQQTYMDIISKTPNTKPGNVLPGASTATEKLGYKNINNVNSALFGDDIKINSFLDDIKTVGGNVDAAKSVIKVANKLSTTDINRLLKSKGSDAAEFFSAQGGTLNMAQRFFKSIGEKGYQKAILDLTTSGSQNWAPLIKKEIIKQTTSKGKQAGLIKLIFQASSPYIRNKVVADSATNTASAIFPEQQ